MGGQHRDSSPYRLPLDEGEADDGNQIEKDVEQIERKQDAINGGMTT